MLNNRFLNCKNFKDLYHVFETEEVVEFHSLTEEELARVARVFEANMPEGAVLPVIPLNEQGYAYIWNTVVNTVEAENINVEEEMEEEVMTENKNNGTMENNFAEFKGLLKEATETMFKGVQVKAGKTKEAYVNQVDESFNVVKGALVTGAKKLSDILGYKALEEDVLGIIEAGGEKGDLCEMAAEVVKRIDAEIELLKAWGNEESLKKAMTLEAATKDERGKSIFESLIAGLIWGAKWVTKKLRQWFQVDNEKSIIGAICRSLSGLVAVLREGAKLVWHTAKFAVSFVVGAAIKIGVWVFRTVKSVVEKVKGWFDKKDEVIEEYEADIDEDDDMEAVEA